jgi:hypothetical protein
MKKRRLESSSGAACSIIAPLSLPKSTNNGVITVDRVRANSCAEECATA